MESETRIIVFVDKKNMIMNSSTISQLYKGKRDWVTLINCQNNTTIVMHCFEN